jgi:hypothetical protein
MTHLRSRDNCSPRRKLGLRLLRPHGLSPIACAHPRLVEVVVLGGDVGVARGGGVPEVVVGATVVIA